MTKECENKKIKYIIRKFNSQVVRKTDVIAGGIGTGIIWRLQF